MTPAYFVVLGGLVIAVVLGVTRLVVASRSGDRDLRLERRLAIAALVALALVGAASIVLFFG